MKIFITACIAALALSNNAQGCAIERSDHNYFMFSVFQRECMDPAYLEDINQYWKDYNSDSENHMDEYFIWSMEDIKTKAKRKGDTQMLTYIKWLNLYISSCGNNDAWDYPSKQELALRKQNLAKVLKASKIYKGTRLKSQYALLRMRANMVLGYDKSNIAYWTATASHLPQSCWKEAMKNIYARALLKGGNRMNACEIYASQGDMTSIKWAARNYRNLAGIKYMYEKDANSPTLTYLVQDFVNNVQQTIDSDPKSDDDKEYIKLIGAKTIYKDEAAKFIEFANSVTKEGKTKAPCLWKSAVASLEYLFGNYKDAVKDINEALSLEGTARMKDNARVIRLLTLSADSPLDEEFSNYLTGEMQWIDKKITEERGNRLDYDNHYTNIKERVVFRNLSPLYIKNGKPEMATALYGMMQKYSNDYQDGATKYLDRAYGNYSDYTCRLDSMTADETAKYYSFITTTHNDTFEKYVCVKVYKSADFFNEMIGTKLIAEGNFSDAEKYLAKIPQKFIDGERINFYMSQRSYSVERWFHRQKAKDEEGFLLTDFADVYGKSNGNQKLQYCKDMLGLLRKYNITKPGVQRDELAYSLAVRYYQASCYGDCWYLTHYGKSVTDSARVNEKDFAAEAIKYLNECKLSENMSLRYKALYALAFIPVDSWYAVEYDSNYNEIHRPRMNSRQYNGLNALHRFSKEHPEAIDNYTTKCDVLKEFESISKLR